MVNLAALLLGVYAPDNLVSPPLPETTLAEIAVHIRNDAGVAVHVPVAVSDRIVYAYWAAQPVEDVLRGIAFGLGLDLNYDDEAKSWSFSIPSAQGEKMKLAKQDLTRLIKNFLTGRLPLPNRSADELEREASSMRAELAELLQVSKRPKPEAVELARRLGITEMTAYQLPVLSELVGADLARLSDLLFSRLDFRDARIIDRAKWPELARRAEVDWSIAVGAPPVGEPIYVWYPERPHPSIVRFCVAALYGNAHRVLSQLVLKVPESVRGKPKFDASLPLYKLEATKLKAPFELQQGCSFEILPDIARQTKLSIVIWCPSIRFRWRALPDRFPIAWLVLDQYLDASRRKMPPPFAFEEQNGWLKLVLRDPGDLGDYRVNWTDLLPTLRKARARGLALPELRSFAKSVALQHARNMSSVSVERPLLPKEDGDLVGGIFMLKALTSMPERHQEQALESGLLVKVGELGSKVKEYILDYFRSARFWPNSAYFWHPAFPEVLSEFEFQVEKKEIEGRSWLRVGVPTHNNDDWFALFPLHTGE